MPRLILRRKTHGERARTPNRGRRHSHWIRGLTMHRLAERQRQLTPGLKDCAFHARVNRAQVAVVACGCKSERELCILDKSFGRNPLLRSTPVWGMDSLLTQVTVVPGATVISLGMKVLWSMLTATTGPAPALFGSSAGRAWMPER
jgi:hypothetical protein